MSSGIKHKSIHRARYWDEVEQKAITLDTIVITYTTHKGQTILVENVFRSHQKLYRIATKVSETPNERCCKECAALVHKDGSICGPGYNTVERVCPACDQCSPCPNPRMYERKARR